MPYVRELENDFFGFLGGSKSDRKRVLGDCLEDWIDFGNVVELTGGDFSLYQAAVVQILLSLSEAESLSGFFEKPFIKLTDTHAACLERGFWEAAVFRRKYGDRREPDDTSS